MTHRLIYALLLLLLPLQVAASRVYHRPLEEVLTSATPVVRARVVSSKVDILPNVLRVTTVLEDIEVVHLKGPQSNTVTHQFSTMLEREVDGKKVRISPIRQGSGQERSLQAGKSYYFVLDPSGTFFLRAEPDERGKEIRALLRRKK